MTFEFPEEEVLKKIIMYTRELVWQNNITENKIEDWLSNFKGEVFSIAEERKLALWLLANFVYYNQTEVEHLCKVIMRNFIHQTLVKKGLEQVNKKNISEIISSTRFISLGRPSESGGLILYLFRLANDLQVKNFSIPSEFERAEIKQVVFVDDITISAGENGQAYNYLKDYNKDGLEIKFLTLIASDEAISSLKKIDVEVIQAISLDKRNKCFSQDSYIFNYYKEQISDFKKFAIHYGLKANPKIPLGYNNSELLFGFYYNTPDNTLPIFWGKENGWNPIFKRVDKNYIRRVTFDDRFI